MSTGTRIVLTKGDEWWVASDEETGVTSQGRTREEALANLDEALEGYYGEGEPPSEADLQRLGIDSEHNVSGSLDESDVFD